MAHRKHDSDLRENTSRNTHNVVEGLLLQEGLIWVFHKEEKDEDQRRRNRTILRQIFSKEVLFGETLIVKAVRCSP